MKNLAIKLSIVFSMILVMFSVSAKADVKDKEEVKKVSEYTMEEQILEAYFNDEKEEIILPIVEEDRKMKVYDQSGNIIATGHSSEIRMKQWTNRSDFIAEAGQELIYMID